MMSSCWQITFKTDGTINPDFEVFLENYFEVYAQNYDDEGNDEYIGYCSGNFDEQSMLLAAKGINLPPYSVEKLESSNWLKDYVIKFDPFEIADFMIYGIHETSTPKTDKIPLQIYAATAFGSDHQTTRSCLLAISELYHNGFVPQKILDVGTGSGILSLAAASLWPQAQITAVDIDDEAVLVTNSNATNNHLDSHIITAQSNGYQSPIVAQNTPYDLILANILARPLLEMAPHAASSLKKGGYAIFSGFVEDQENWIISEHQKHNFSLSKLYKLDNWRAALMQKE
ncbi:MAG: methyltransferase domain-containing protein [Alphaproteobacteria bacterium]|nr:methyltransferase domain-containing protein [Alphaproteobacteria bacterium]